MYKRQAQYGADALRLTLVLGSTPGNDMRFSDEKIKASRHFANKLWNATRFVMMNLPEDFQAGLPAADKLDPVSYTHLSHASIAGVAFFCCKAGQKLKNLCNWLISTEL